MSGMVWDEATVAALVEAGVGSGLGKAAGHLLQEANRTVPLEESTLEKSGTTSVDGLSATVSYDTKYAARQHEELNWRHSPGRRAKWLERALAEQNDTLNEMIAAGLASALGL